MLAVLSTNHLTDITDIGSVASHVCYLGQAIIIIVAGRCNQSPLGGEMGAHRLCTPRENKPRHLASDITLESESALPVVLPGEWFHCNEHDFMGNQRT